MVRRLAFVVPALLAVAALSAPGTSLPARATSAAVVTAQAVRVHPPPRTFSVAATGDVITESAVNVTAAAAAAAAGERFDYASIFVPVAPVLRGADLAICHMEIPIGAPGARPGVYGRSPFGGNLILAPFEIAAGLRGAGFDRCSTASNHSNDLGPAGITSTLDALDAVGLAHNGTARTPSEAVVSTFVVNGVRVAHLSYTRYSNTTPPEPWRMSDATSVAQVAADVDQARAEGAEVEILSIHISQEMLPAPTPADRAFVTDVTAAARVNLVIEHGPHVVQPLERVNGTWVFWSVGNFVTGMGWNQTGRYSDQRTMDGLLAWVRFTESTTEPGRFLAEATPALICNERVSRTVHPVLPTLTDPNISADLRSQMQLCLARSAAVVADLR